MSSHTAIPARIPVPSGAAASGDGLIIGSGSVVVDAYIDFQCPFCKRFEERSRPTFERLILEGAITMIYHPLGFLDQLSTNHHSSRAANAAAAASDVGRFAPYKDVLFAGQPEQGGPGPDDNELVELGRSIGIDEPEVGTFADGVFSGTYLTWTAYLTELALERGIGGTPTLFVAGVAVPANPETISAAVADAASP
jgi:protein-disulfide isomerase